MKLRESRSESALRLFKLAQSQGGYFTTSQAVEVGYLRQYHSAEIDTRWRKICRGVFRLTILGEPSHVDLLHVLRLSNLRRDGTEGLLFSGHTAARLHGLLLPEVNFRLQNLDLITDNRTLLSSINKSNHLHDTPLTSFNDFDFCATYTPDLSKLESTRLISGLYVTSPMVTLIQLLSYNKVDLDLIKSLYIDARRRNLITKVELQNSINKNHSRAKVQIFLGWESLLRSLDSLKCIENYTSASLL